MVKKPQFVFAQAQGVTSARVVLVLQPLLPQLQTSLSTISPFSVVCMCVYAPVCEGLEWAGLMTAGIIKQMNSLCLCNSISIHTKAQNLLAKDKSFETCLAG
jgi:hypothetical protein